MSRFISPSIEEVQSLKPPLNEGERVVFDLFNDYLPPEWEIYVQPHLNGLRPDFVLLNPQVGIAVFEVKDWDLDAMEYWVDERPGKPPILMGKKDGKVFSDQKNNPIEKIYLYKKEINDLYCPRLDQKFGLAAITAGVIFPNASEARVHELFSSSIRYRKMDQYPNYYPISGVESVWNGSIHRVFPESSREKVDILRNAYLELLWEHLVKHNGDRNGYNFERDKMKTELSQKPIDKQIDILETSLEGVTEQELERYSNRRLAKFSGSSTERMNPTLAKDLRNWLIEPDFSATQRQPLELELDENQLKFATTRTPKGYRRIKGPAGSGKSLVLAARAAELFRESKNVLVVTYNITLLNYLQDLAVRWFETRGKVRKGITWLNFHSWCKRVCIESENEDKWKDVLNPEFANIITSIIKNDNEELIERYDAVLVDEGQDFLPSWWDALRQVCRPGGEMLLVADATQDVYGNARFWTDETMKGAGFSGGWAELKKSYRLPQDALLQAIDFAEQFLPKDTLDLPEALQINLGLEPCKLKWIQTDLESSFVACEKEVLYMAKDTSIPNITFLTIDKGMGLKLVSAIEAKDIRVIHTFGKDDFESRRKKMAFYMGDARVKATTLHSFKGWESSAIVFYVGSSTDERSLARIYTGLTRVKKSPNGSFLTVISCAPELKSYGETWANT